MDSQDYKAKFNELATRLMTENVKIWQRYAEAVGRFTSGEAQSANTQGQTANFAVQEGGKFVRDLMQLSLNYYSILLDMSVDFTNRMLDQALQPSAREAAPEPEAAPPPSSGGTRFELVLSGQQGQTVASPFVVENKQAQAADVSFEITEFISEDGTTRFRAPVEFAPERFELEPGAEQVVQCRLSLGAEFVSGRRYMALVRVTGFPGMEIGLIVVPQPAGTEDQAPAEPGAAPEGSAAN